MTPREPDRFEAKARERAEALFARIDAALSHTASPGKEEV